ncbi:MAG: glycosyltransferase family 2 protein [Candidatus Nanoarchaeia archaeon]
MTALVKKKISVSSGCYNEADNLREWYERVVKALKQFPQYDYEIVIADNYSNDGSREILREIAATDKNFKVILNSNNFGHIRSPHNALMNCSGDAVIQIVSDLQEPPELIPEMIRYWEKGYKVVVAVKPKSKENFFMSCIRKIYYYLLSKMSDSTYIVRNFTGFGLYDRQFIEAAKKFHSPYPYFRGLIGEIGFKRKEIEFIQEKRKHGKTKNNFFTLYDLAMTGFVNHSKLPLRLAAFTGFCIAGISLLVSFIYLVYKLLYWNTFSLGMAPVVIGLFFFSAIQLIFIGIIGEYVGAILTQVKNHPLVI